MTLPEQNSSAAFRNGFLSCGWRPFFLAAGLWATAGMGLWISVLHGWPVLASAFDPVSWHAHEALFGYLGAVLAGFLLTAVPNWTGRPAPTGWPLAGLLALWLAGRVAIGVSESASPVVVAVLDLSFPVILGTWVLHEIVATRNWRNLVVVALIGVLVAGNALFHREATSGGLAASGYGLRLGLAAAIMLISVIGGRIVPAFTRNWLAARGSENLPAKFGLLDGLALGLTLASLASWVVLPVAAETGWLLLAAGIVQAARLSRWRAVDTRREPLLWILHAGYAFVPFGMLGVGGAILWPDILPPASTQHLWMAGAVGVMTLAVMTRATLGHSGRELTAGTGTATLYLLVVASVLARFAGGVLTDHATVLWTLSAILWCGGFAGFVLLYGPLLIGQTRR